ncbi:MAG: GlsB/YeaQ/YmgE family stress response membrane protein [Steroidobacteraceae bacterium]
MSFFLLWMIVGIVIGSLGSLIMRCNADRSAVLSTLVGILGALLAGRLLAPFLGGPLPTQGFFTLSAVLVSLLGAVILVGLVNLLRLGRIR